jgi:DNA adenine methylase
MVLKLRSSTIEEKQLLPPFLKWPGGKRRLIQFLLPLLPRHFKFYYEPFMGSGALFFALQPKHAFLSDKNPELIATYREVCDHPGAVIKKLNELKNTEDHYYAVRDSLPKSRSARAARLIYLSRLSFNGIHRVNLQGRFNVPYGHKTHLVPCDPDKLRTASSLLRRAHLACEDFESAVADAGRGDLVYFDPPYTTAHTNNGFLKYNAKIFTWNDQKRLSDVAHDLRRRGCSVFISNADHDSIRSLYKDFDSLRITRHSVIAASSVYRRQITECVFHASPKC